MHPTDDALHLRKLARALGDSHGCGVRVCGIASTFWWSTAPRFRGETAGPQSSGQRASLLFSDDGPSVTGSGPARAALCCAARVCPGSGLADTQPGSHPASPPCNAVVCLSVELATLRLSSLSLPVAEATIPRAAQTTLAGSLGPVEPDQPILPASPCTLHPPHHHPSRSLQRPRHPGFSPPLVILSLVSSIPLAVIVLSTTSF